MKRIAADAKMIFAIEYGDDCHHRTIDVSWLVSWASEKASEAALTPEQESAFACRAYSEWKAGLRDEALTTLLNATILDAEQRNAIVRCAVAGNIAGMWKMTDDGVGLKFYEVADAGPGLKAFRELEELPEVA